MTTHTLLTLDEIKRRLEDRNLSEIARRVGMRRQQIWLVAAGHNTNPSYETIKRLSDYLTGGN
jgi:transcriptional regulator with XRE-family HTH domain